MSVGHLPFIDVQVHIKMSGKINDTTGLSAVLSITANIKFSINFAEGDLKTKLLDEISNRLLHFLVSLLNAFESFHLKNRLPGRVLTAPFQLATIVSPSIWLMSMFT